MVRFARKRSDSGAAAVEFGLVAFVLILLLFGIIQFGHLFFQWLEITHAAREGARWAALGNPTGTVTTAGSTRFKVREAAPGLNPPLSNAQIQVVPSNPAGSVGQPVRVTVTYPTPLFAPLMQNIFGVGSATTFTLQSAATQRIE